MMPYGHEVANARMPRPIGHGISSITFYLSDLPQTLLTTDVQIPHHTV